MENIDKNNLKIESAHLSSEKQIESTSTNTQQALLRSQEILLEMEKTLDKLSAHNDNLYEEIAAHRQSNEEEEANN